MLPVGERLMAMTMVGPPQILVSRQDVIHPMFQGIKTQSVYFKTIIFLRISQSK